MYRIICYNKYSDATTAATNIICIEAYVITSVATLGTPPLLLPISYV